MRCKTSVLRRLIREAVLDGWEARGEFLVSRLSYHKDRLVIGQRVILEPTEEDLKEWEEKRLLSAEKTTKGHIAMVQLMDDRLSHIGQMGVITKIPFMGRREITVRFDDGSTMGADWHYFLVAVAVDRPDWRPDETLPEDYYAL